MRTLNLSKETVDVLIDLNKKDRASEEPGTVMLSEIEPLSNEAAAAHAALLELLLALPRQAAEELTALMWIGRGSEFANFDHALDYAKDHYVNPQAEAGYISEKPLFEYLPQGLEKLRAENIQLA